MSAKILSGTIVRDVRIIELIKKFKSVSPIPELAIIQVGDRADSVAYIGAKLAFAKKVGVIAHHVHLAENCTQEELILEIKKNNADPQIKGIIVQLPLPNLLDREAVINTIKPRKDIDGLTSTNMELLNLGRPKVTVPATARGIMELLVHYGVNVRNKKITVVGRSQLVGKPIAQLLKSEGALVTVAHSQTVDLINETKQSDIIVVAVGKPHLIKAEHVIPGQIIIDVGINREVEEVNIENKKAKLVGDVDFNAVVEVLGENGAITPVPGGVGPMTVLCLFENLADVCV